MAGRVVFGITSNSMIDFNKLPSRAKAGCGQSTRKFHSTRKKRGSLHHHPYSDRPCLTLWRTAWRINLGCSNTAIHMDMARQCTMANLNTSRQQANLVSSTPLHMVGNKVMHNLARLNNTYQLVLSRLVTNNIHTRLNSHSSSRRINRTGRRQHLYQREQHPRLRVRAQEHRIPNPASIILLTRSWRIAVTTSGHMHTCSRPLCTKSRKTCSRSVSNGSRSFNVMAPLNSTSKAIKSGGSLAIWSVLCGNIRIPHRHLHRPLPHNQRTVMLRRALQHRTMLRMAKPQRPLLVPMLMLQASSDLRQEMAAEMALILSG